MIKEGTAHHPHSLINAKPIADWIVGNLKPSSDLPPAFVDQTFVKSSYYSLENSYLNLPEEKTYATCGGPGFTECYDRCDVTTESQWGITGWGSLCPRQQRRACPGNSGRMPLNGMPRWTRHFWREVFTSSSRRWAANPVRPPRTGTPPMNS